MNLINSQATRRISVICFLLLMLFGVSLAQGAAPAPSFNLGSATGTPGTTVTIPVTLTNVAGATIAAVGIDIGYDTSKFETPTAVIGTVGSAAGKMLTLSSPASGVYRIGVLGFNTTAIGDGVVINVSFTIKATASGGDATLSNTPDASDPEGNTVSVTGASGKVTVNVPTYTVTYNGNGNTSGTVPADSGTYLNGATVTVLGAGTLTRSGYSFNGWNTAANGSGTSYAAAATFSMVSANVTLYAQWTALPTYTVTYNGNSNTGGTVPTDSGTYLNGATVTALGVGILTKTGYSFNGWNTLANGQRS